MKVTIDHERYGEESEFDSIEAAQRSIRLCGADWADTTLSVQWNDAENGSVWDERGERVGTVSAD